MNRKVYILQSVQTLRALAVIALMLLMATTAWADDNGICGENVTYTFEESTGTLTISGSGAMADYAADETNRAPWDSYRFDIKTVVIGSGVTSISNFAFRYCTGLTSVTIPASVTSIGNYACSCTGLTSVTIPYGVTSIGNYAFEQCSELTSVTIPSSVTSIGDFAFNTCLALKSVTIPYGVTSIGIDAFEQCKKLTSVTIPSSVTSIGARAFSYCLSLSSVFIFAPQLTPYDEEVFNYNAKGRKIYVPKDCAGNYQEGWKQEDFKDDIVEFDGYCGVPNVNGGKNVAWVLTDEDNDANYIKETLTIAGSGDMNNYVSDSGAPWNNYKSSIKTVVIENGVTTIGSNAFYLCQGLTSVTIPYGVTDIGFDAFHGCENLASVTIPSSVTDIQGRAFFGCSGLTSVTIPSSVMSIEEGAFYGCFGLTSVTIPASVTSMGEEVFSNCSALESITVDKDNPKYDSRDGCNAIIEKNGKTLITGCKNTVIPSSVTNIGKHAFDGCTGLTSVTIPASVTSIEEGAFYGCENLTSVTIPASVTSIGKSAFYGCENLTSVTIPASVTSIGDDAFIGCTGVSDVYCFADPDNLTWVESSNDFITDPDKTTKTVCHVAGSKLATFESKWNKGEDTDVNVTFMGDGIEPNGENYLATTRSYGSGTPPEGVKAFLPVSYDLNTATVELAEVKGAPKNLPVIYGSATDGEALPALFFVKYLPDNSYDAKAIDADYKAVEMSKRFVVTDGKETLSEVISGTDVSASEAVILVLTNGKFTTVDFSAADLDKKAQAGLLLFVLSKWEYMQIKPATSNAAATATARTIGIGEGETTGIEAVQTTPDPSLLRRGNDGGDWYDLQGRRIAQPTRKGIYIRDGKKIIIK